MKNKFHISFSLITLLAMVVLVSTAEAATNYTWTGTTNTAWATTTNWSPNGNPGSATGDIVNIPAVTNQPLVTVAPANALVSLTFTGTATLTITGVTLTVTGAVANNTASATGTVTGTGTLTCGSVSIADGAALTFGTVVLNVSGTTTVGGGASGTMTFSSATGVKTFTGLVTVNSGATWTESAAAIPTFQGGITNNGTYTASTGVHTFSTNSQALTGTFTIPSVTVAGITLTNNGTLTVGTALAGVGGTLSNSGTLNYGGTCSVATLTNYGIVTSSGTGTTTSATVTNNLTFNMGSTGTVTAFTNAAAASVLNITGTAPTITTLTVSAVGNTVNYTGAAQIVRTGTTFYNLSLSGSAAKTMTGVTTITNNFSMSGSVTATPVITTVGGNVNISGTAVMTTGANLAITGSLTIGSGSGFTRGANYTLSAPTITVNGTFTNSSTGALTGNITVGATTGVLALGTVNFTLTGNLINNNSITGTTTQLSISGSVTNTGTISLSTGRIMQTGSSDFTNSGSITFTGAGRLYLSGNFTNSGTLSLNATQVRLVGTGSGSYNIAGFTTTGLVTVSAAAGTYTFTGNVSCNGITISGATVTLNLGVGLTHTSSAAVNISNAGATLNGGSSIINLSLVGTPFARTGTFTPATGTVNYSGAGNQTCLVTTYYNLTISGTLVKTFATTPTVNNILSMEGTTASITVTTGVVTYGANATLQYNKTAAFTATLEEWISPFTATGGVVIENTGTITANAAKTFTNCPLTVKDGATLNNGGFAIGSPNALNLYCGGATAGSTITGAGTLTLGGNVSVTDANNGTAGATISCPIALGATRIFTVADDGTTAVDLTVSSIISGATFGITKAGNGTLALSGVNTFTGGTTLNAGTLDINNSSALGTVAGTFVINGGTIDNTSAADITTLNYPLTLNGDFTYSGSVPHNLNLGTGAITINANSQITVSAGTLTIGGAVSAASYNLTKAGNGTLSFGTNTVTLNGITISAGTLTSTSVTMSLAGNFSNSGTFTHNSGTVTFNGASAQTISGSSSTTFNNLTLNNSAGLSINSITVAGTLTLTSGALSVGSNTLTFQTSNTPISIGSGTITTTTSSNLVFGTVGNTGGNAFAIPNGTFTTAPSINNLTINRTNTLTLNNQMMSVNGILLCNGPLATNGNLTLLSTAAQTALIDGSSTGSVTGNVTMQRYLPSAFGYKYVSSPFQSLTVNGFSSYVDLTATFPTFYSYNENNQYNSQPIFGWVNYTTTTNPLNPMQGYAANFGSSSNAVTVNITGAVNNGAMSITLYNHNQTYTLGFNLVGNPYPSAIDWNAASGWTKTNIDNALYYFKASTDDQYTGTYSSYVGGFSSDGLATNIIPSMQGFFIHVTDGTYPVMGTLGVTNSVRVNDQTHGFLKSMVGNTFPLIRITAGFADNGTPSDPAVIYFDSSATQLFDRDLDALKLMNTDTLVPNLYSMTPDTRRLSINAVPFPTDSIDIIPLGLRTAKDGWITFDARDVERIPAGMYIYLLDAAGGINQDLKSNSQYRIFLNAGEYENRFSLAFSRTIITSVQKDIPTKFSLSQNYPNPFNPCTTIKYSIPQTSFVSITVYNILGKEVSKLINEEKLSGSYEVQFDGNKLSSGVYFYRLQAGNFSETKKLMLLK